MEQALKQRLVGAGVIIALGIIVIPMILDGAGERQLRSMPDEPAPKQTLIPGKVIKEKQDAPGYRKTTQIVLKLPDEKQAASTSQSPAATQKPVKVTKPVAEKPAPKPAAKPAPKPVKETAKKPPVKPVVKAKPAPPKPVKQASKPKTVSKPKPAGELSANWVVQVGSFTDAKKAFSMRDSLRKKRYRAFVEKVSGRTGQSMYRVRVGPVPRRAQADKLSIRLKNDKYRHGFVTKHP